MLEELSRLGLVDIEKIVEFHPRTRDFEDLKVFRCEESGVIFLKNQICDFEHYQKQSSFDYWGIKSDQEVEINEDDLRRVSEISKLLPLKSWVDVGSGFGGPAVLLRDKISRIEIVEPQKDAREFLKKSGFIGHEAVQDLDDRSFELVTLFHVLEHIPSPQKLLKEIAEKMLECGRIVIEVPNARDALISFYNCQSFRNFTFWSEHLVLYTLEALTKLLESSGFENIETSYVQRYPLSNHLYWLSNQKPGGHKVWGDKFTQSLTLEYEKNLIRLGMTDTIWVTATKELCG